jgi:hypothetical protein
MRSSEGEVESHPRFSTATSGWGLELQATVFGLNLLEGEVESHPRFYDAGVYDE